jgi:membrane-associated phospholipid phosphatase
MVVDSLKRPYRVTLPMVVLVLLVPFYLYIAEETRNRAVGVPELALDRAIPLQPAWALIYGALYLFLIVLPVFAVRQDEQIRRTVLSYLMVWVTAYVCFFFYPTIAPRPETVAGEGFMVWGLRSLYGADPPFNCFPSLHVAHSFVSALTCYRVHRGVGVVAMVCAALVGVSTLYTRQHYVLDVVAGILLAFLAYWIFLRNYSRQAVPEPERRLAPVLALCLFALILLAVAGFWAVYELGQSNGVSAEIVSSICARSARALGCVVLDKRLHAYE